MGGPLYRGNRFPFDRCRRLTVDADRHVADERDAIELAVEIGIENVPWREVRGGEANSTPATIVVITATNTMLVPMSAATVHAVRVRSRVGLEGADAPPPALAAFDTEELGFQSWEGFLSLTIATGFLMVAIPFAGVLGFSARNVAESVDDLPQQL